MMKKGFTLQELLISLAIVGVVAAITVPGIIGMMPDKKKAMYMKCYSTLTNLTNEILDDPVLYYKNEEDCVGLACQASPNAEAYPQCSGDWSCDRALKFPAIFATKVNYIERAKLPNALNFRTADGVLWTFTAAGDSGYNLVLDLNPDDDENDCFYNSAQCTEPDQFRFEIDKYGGISAEDALGKAFLRNATDMHSIRKDKEVANGL